MIEKELTIYLHGYLGDTYSREPIKLYATSLRDVMRGLGCKFGQQFTIDIRANSWHFTKGERDTTEDIPVEGDKEVFVEELDLGLSYDELHIYPKLSGSFAAIGGIISSIVGSIAGGIVSITGGAIGIGAATTIAEGILILAASAALKGIVGAISAAAAPSVDYEQAEVDRKASFLYNGVVNVIEQGGPVPLVYGRHLVGSTVISAALVSEQLGELENYLPEEIKNLWNPSTDDWYSEGALASKDEGQLLITKETAANSYGGIYTPLTLASDSYFYITVTYITEYDFHTEQNYGGNFITYKGLRVSILDEGVVLKEIDHTYSVFSKVIPDTYHITTRFRFKTRSSQVSTRLRIAPMDKEPVGTVATITSLRISDGENIEPLYTGGFS